ncbi:MAG: hypothetical protein JWM57_795, partial [Phycisphaerales bacterium]|nr:hypothetical protein [Phycisphaerales bacterium]
MTPTRQTVLEALARVVDPELHKDIVTLNWVKDVTVAEQDVVVTLEVPAAAMVVKDSIERAARQAIGATGAQRVDINFLGARTGGPAAAAQPPKNLPQVKNVVAVGAGKGGVGKSTMAVNIAVGLHRRGYKVGLMDGDIYGPSIPTLLGIRGVVSTAQNNKILPHHVHGIHAITIGSLVEQDKPLIWRGPMAHGAFKQLLVDNTLWPELDYMIVDLPPGTGDVPLTLCQLLGITGAVIVATPQQVALDDAIRAVKMFQQLGAPILGMVENMAGDIFGHGGTEKTAADLELPFLGRLELYKS